MGWARAQGVFFYAGTAQEQWTALLAAAAAPPPSFAVAAYGSLAAFGRQLRHPHCAAKPPGPRCVLAAAKHVELGDEPGACGGSRIRSRQITHSDEPSANCESSRHERSIAEAASAWTTSSRAHASQPGGACA